jgi:hypothetical protein
MAARRHRPRIAEGKMQKPILTFAGLAAAAAMALAPAHADASCRGRKNTGTLVGGVGGGLVGAAVSHSVAGVVIGGIGGAVVGHEIARSGCKSSVRRRHHPQRATH